MLTDFCIKSALIQSPDSATIGQGGSQQTQAQQESMWGGKILMEASSDVHEMSKFVNILLQFVRS